jgi:hypothetical protein
MSDLLESAIVGVASGTVASALFFFLLFQLRPRLQVAPRISVTADNQGNPVYWIKFVNRAKRDVMDVHCTLLRVRKDSSPGGVYNHREKILSATIPHLPAYRRKDVNSPYAYRLLGEGDIFTLWPDGEQHSLLFIITARDSVSGFSRSFRCEYRDKGVVLAKGSFRYGLDLSIDEVIEVPPLAAAEAAD